MKKLLLLLFVTITITTSVTKAQCPPGAFAYKSTYAQCASGCGVLLIGWPAGVLVNIYGGSPLTIITSAVISGTLGSGGTGDAFVCVPCDIPLVFAAQTNNATTGCVIALIGTVPVKLSNFSTTANGTKGYTIKWTGSNETTGTKYTVQRSANGRDFTNLTTITAEDNGQASNHYAYNDDAALAGNNYYRIKTNELSGSESYSEIALVKKQQHFSISVYPNPVVNGFKVTIPEKFLPATVELVNSLGQPVYSTKTMQATLSIDKLLKNGMYSLRVTGSDNITVTQKLIKQ
ncbi:MAG TPA: T9SS type A sorting domain-containing protein [Ferruginibacter sp.]|nr:T9SS type A sorting domain-containing protein [Ferruginibacter sp.]HMP21468.1 T9SS type A sorting domain-containing protein [Ferruginibacter sp.]